MVTLESASGRPLLTCLQQKGLFLTDMKLENIGYATTIDGKTVFRLLDLDAIGEPVSTYPAKKEFATFETGFTRENAITQTMYAFWLALLASYLVKKTRQWLLQSFRHDSFVEPTRTRPNRKYKRPDERLRLLDDLASFYGSNPEIARAIEEIKRLLPKRRKADGDGEGPRLGKRQAR